MLLEMFWQLDMQDSTKIYVVIFGILAICLYLMWANKQMKNNKTTKFWKDNKFWFIVVVLIIVLYVYSY